MQPTAFSANEYLRSAVVACDFTLKPTAAARNPGGPPTPFSPDEGCFSTILLDVSASVTCRTRRHPG